MTENTPINNTQRIQVVDALRGFAIIAIMLVHFLEHFIYNSYPVSSSPAMASVNERVNFLQFFLFCWGFNMGFNFENICRTAMSLPDGSPGGYACWPVLPV